MTQKKIILLLFLFTAIASPALFLLKKKQLYTVQIGLSFNRTILLWQDTASIRNWFIYKDPDPISYRQIPGNPLIATYAFRRQKEEQIFTWIASPEQGNEYYTTLTLQYKTNWWDYLTGGNQLEKAAISCTDRFSRYTKDVVHFYGFPITTTTVQDSTFLFGSAIAERNMRAATTVQLFNQLVDFANAKKAGYSGTAICYFENLPDNKIQIKASISITEPATIPELGRFELKRMPYGKNLLVMQYEGPFNKIPDAYRILEQFRDDHNFKSMAIPYQEYPDIRQAYADSQQVSLQLFYPVF